MCTLDYAATSLRSHDDFARKAVEILEQEHLLVIRNSLNDDEVQVLHDYCCKEDLHGQQAGHRAIGEKDASKRSGTRLYNCLCQKLGLACDFCNWKDRTSYQGFSSLSQSISNTSCRIPETACEITCL